MLQRALVSTVIVIAAVVWPSANAGGAHLTQGQSTWQKTASRHFEIHYLPALAPDLERVTRSAERAYDLISQRLNFFFPTRVPLVMFSPSGALTREEVWPIP